MALNITAEQYAVAQTYVANEDYAGGWNYLASIDDTYADNAYVVTTGDTDGIVDVAFHTMVKERWGNTGVASNNAG